MTQEILKLDRHAIDEIKAEIKQLTLEIKELTVARGDAFNGGLVDNWLKPSEVKVIDNDIRLKQERLNQLTSIRYVLVEASHEEGIVDINGTYKLHLKYESGKESDYIIKLITGTPNNSFNTGYPQVSTRSPIGAAILGKRVGDTTSFKSPMGSCNVTILEEIKESENEQL